MLVTQVGAAPPGWNRCIMLRKLSYEWGMQEQYQITALSKVQTEQRSAADAHHVRNFLGLDRSSPMPAMRLRSMLKVANGSVACCVVSSASKCVHLVRPDRPKLRTCAQFPSIANNQGNGIAVIRQ